MYSPITEYKFDTNSPFANDPLDRGDIAKNLTRLVEASSRLVMSISAPWGQGKTTFVRMWQSHLENEGFTTLYFNAWESDYAEDPLISFMGTLREVSARDKSRLENVGAKVREIAKKFVKASPKIALNYLFRGGLNYIADGDVEAKDEVEAISEMAASFATQQMLAQESAKQLLINFQDELRSFADEVTSDGKPLVIFIDELDRCRPEFSIELLEQIKHLFSVDGIVFILSVDRDRVGCAASHLLGFPPEDADGYLRRLIDIDFDISISDNASFLKHWATHIEIPDSYRQGLLNTVDQLGLLAQGLGISLRAQQQCLQQLSVAWRSYGNLRSEIAYSLPWLLLFTSYDRRLVERVWIGNEDPTQLLRILDSILNTMPRDENASRHTRVTRIRETLKVWLSDNLGQGVLSTPGLQERVDAIVGDFGTLQSMRQIVWDIVRFAEKFRS